MNHRESFHSKGYSQYGAQMGRRSDPFSSFIGATNARCVRVLIDRGGYDPGGAYWGTPSNLWYVKADSADGEEVLEAYVRAPNRDAAKAKFPTSVKWKR